MRLYIFTFESGNPKNIRAESEEEARSFVTANFPARVVVSVADGTGGEADVHPGTVS